MAICDNPYPLGPPRPPMVLEQMILALMEKVDALALQVNELEDKTEWLVCEVETLSRGR